MIEYRLIRSDRRTLSISIDREGALVVHAPKRMSVREIEAFLLQKRRWIGEKQKAVCAAAAEIPPMTEGARVPFWGETLTIAFSGAKKAVHDSGILWIPNGADAALQAWKWRLEQAERLLAPLVGTWAIRTGLIPAKTAYGNAQTRWGSMNCRTRSLRLNAALVHCPPEAADYVIVHELAHLIHPDHSPAFHAAVRSFLPDADLRRDMLKKYAHLLRLWR